MNRAASHLANRKELQRAEQNGRLLKAEVGRDRKERLPRHSLKDGRGYQVDYLTSTDQEIPDRLVTTACLEEMKTTIRLVIKSWFVDVGLSTGDSIWGLLFLI